MVSEERVGLPALAILDFGAATPSDLRAARGLHGCGRFSTLRAMRWTDKVQRQDQLAPSSDLRLRDVWPSDVDGRRGSITSSGSASRATASSAAATAATA